MICNMKDARRVAASGSLTSPEGPDKTLDDGKVDCNESKIQTLHGIDNYGFNREDSFSSLCSSPSLSSSTSAASFNNSERRRLWKVAKTKGDSRNLFTKTLDETSRFRRRIHFTANDIRQRLSPKPRETSPKSKTRSTGDKNSSCHLEYRKENLKENKVKYSSVLKNYNVGFLPVVTESAN